MYIKELEQRVCFLLFLILYICVFAKHMQIQILPGKMLHIYSYCVMTLYLLLQLRPEGLQLSEQAVPLQVLGALLLLGLLSQRGELCVFLSS